MFLILCSIIKLFFSGSFLRPSPSNPSLRTRLNSTSSSQAPDFNPPTVERTTAAPEQVRMAPRLLEHVREEEVAAAGPTSPLEDFDEMDGLMADESLVVNETSMANQSMDEDKLHE